MKLLCKKKITYGENVLCGWNCTFDDGDGHSIINMDTGLVSNENKPIEIGNHVWFGANVNVLKGAFVPDDVVIGLGSCVTKKFSETNCIIAGTPAKVVKRGITWSE